MIKITPQNQIEEKLRWIKPVIEKRFTLDEISELSPVSRRTLCNWIKNYKQDGEIGLLDKSTKPKHSPNKTPSWLENKVIDLNLDFNLGALKIHWKLQEEGIILHERTINKILLRHGLCKRNRSVNKNIYHRRNIVVPGELVEIDIKYGVNFGFNRWYYQYTAIDVASRWRYLYGFNNMQNSFTKDFMLRLLERTNHLFRIKSIKTDNGIVFTNRFSGDYGKHSPNRVTHILDTICQDHQIKHYLIAPGCPTQNAHVERSHRTDQEYFYNFLPKPNSLEEFNYRLALWNSFYNDLPHCGLNGKTPNEYLRQFN